MEKTEEKEQTFYEYLDNDIANRELRTNENSNGVLTIQQTQRNALRKEVADKFVEFLLDNGIDSFQTKDGIIIKVDNKYVGAVSIELKLAFKALGYDPEEQAELFDEERDNKDSAAEEKAKSKAKKESK